jgi:two-component system NtrC family response regulator
MNPQLLVVDDEDEIRTQMKWALADHYTVSLAASREEALAGAAAQAPELVLLDLGLPPSPDEPTEGLLTLATLISQNRFLKVIVITGQGERSMAMKAISDGAYDFLTKPVDMDELRIILKRARYVAQLEREHDALQRRVTEAGFEGMIGSSPEMQDVFRMIRKVSTTEAPVLILGESGTGKEMTALAIHRLSSRAAGPFVPINCTAIPENLLESELFGHEKGSFTGAHAQCKGRFEAAQGGTLFLDEIGDLPASVQIKLLRFLQDRMIERVGGRGSIEINTRILAATNNNLESTIEAGRFREDLYYRLAVVVIRMPPLRERSGDIPIVAKALLHKHALQSQRTLSGFSPEAIRLMGSYPWPGNIRELENRIKRAIIMTEGHQITLGDLDLTGSLPDKSGKSLKEARETLERTMIFKSIERNSGTISRAAEELGISRPTLYELMAKLGIKRNDVKGQDSTAQQ